MASTFSPNLKIELIGVGDQAGVWGTTTNNNLAYTLEQAIVGGAMVIFPTDADYTLTIANSTAPPQQPAKAVWLTVSATVPLTAARRLIIPTALKNYVIKNTTTRTISVTTNLASSTAVSIPSGSQFFVYCDSVNVTLAFDYTLNGIFSAGTPTVNSLFTRNFKLNSDSVNPIGVVQYPTAAANSSSAIVWGSADYTAFNVTSSTYISLDPTINVAITDAISINSNNIYLGGSKNTTTNVHLGSSILNRAVATSVTAGGTTFPSITATGTDESITLGVSGKGTFGSVFIGNSLDNYVLVRGAITGGTPVISAAGSALAANIGLNVFARGTGVLNLGNSSQNSINVTGAVTGSAPKISSAGTVDTNIGLTLAPLGTGVLTLGNTTSWAGFTVGANTSTAFSQLTASNGTANCDLVLAPAGTGDLYPIGRTLSATTTNQPTIFVASSQGATALGPGASLQVLTSNGVSGSPFWGNTNLVGGQITRVVEPITTVTATASALTVDINVASLFNVTNLTGTTTLTVSNASVAIVADNTVYSFSIISRQLLATAFINAITITGATTTLRWATGVAPTLGSALGAFDLYQFSIFRTAANTYSVLATRSPY